MSKKSHKVSLGIDQGLKNMRAAIMIGNEVYMVNPRVIKQTKGEIARKMFGSESNDTKQIKNGEENLEKDTSLEIVQFARREGEKAGMPLDDLFQDCDQEKWEKFSPEEKQSKLKRILASVHAYMKKNMPDFSKMFDKSSKDGLDMKKKSVVERKEGGNPTLPSDKPSVSSSTSDSSMNIDELLANSQAKSNEIYKLPNVVVFKDGKSFVDQEALALKEKNIGIIIFDVRNILGKNYTDAAVTAFINTHPNCKVINKNGKPAIVVGSGSPFYAEYLLSLILLKLRLISASFLPQSDLKIEFSTVISVPVYFDENQRKAIQESGKIASLKVTGVVNECSAAVLAYLHQHKVKRGELVLVLNMSKTTTCVSVLQVKGTWDIVTVAFSKDEKFGGEQLDSELVDHLLEIIYEKKQIHIQDNSIEMQKIRDAVENAKIALSSDTQTVISLQDLKRNQDIEYQISRQTFESVCSAEFGKVTALCKACLNHAKVREGLIKKAILVGGSTRVPKVTTLLQQVVPGVTVLNSIDQDEVIAYGAAVQAAVNAGNIYDL